jgi:lysophospholipase L1-like esterase
MTNISASTLAIAFLLSIIQPISGQTGAAATANAPRPGRGIENAPALANFFHALSASKSGARRGPVRILQFGDSHTAADILTAEIRHNFQEDFGDGGAGFLVPRNPMSTRRHGAASGASSGWVVEGIGGRIASDGIYGPAGIALGTSLPNERAWLQTTAERFEVFFVRQPGGGSIDILVDGATVLKEPLSLAARLPRLGHFSYDAAAASHRLEVHTLDAGKVRLLGIVAENLNGVAYDVCGINGARAERLFTWNATAFAAALAERKPDLIIIAYGTNEAGDPDWTSDGYQQLLAGLLRRMHAMAPQASVLIYGPPDRADLTLGARRMPALIEAERRAAVAGNAAFWNSYTAMGGRGSMNAWVAQGLGQGDHVHLSGPGYVRMGDMFYQDLRRAFDDGVTNSSRIAPNRH